MTTEDFFTTPDGPHFSAKKFLAAWNEKVIGSGKNAKTNDELNRLRSHTQTLWQNLNLDRTSLNRDYLDSAAGVQAYTASFLTTNVQRVFAIFTQKDVEKYIRETVSQLDELTLADVGSGPLSASVGTLAAITKILPQKRFSKIRVLAVERSEKIYSLGAELLKLACSEEVSLERFTSVVKLTSEINFALFANVLNELPEKHRKTFVTDVLKRTAPGAMTLLLEPGQETHSRKLADLRDELLPHLTEAKMRIVAPCFHIQKCPLSSASGRKDWCWFKIHWQRPEALAKIDTFTKLDHRDLNFSYVLFGPQVENHSTGYGRVVSDVIQFAPSGDARQRTLDYVLKNKINSFQAVESDLGAVKGKVLVCAHTGELEGVLAVGKTEAELARGRGLESSEGLFRFRERS